MIRVASVDDEALAVERLQTLCMAMEEVRVVATGASAADALAIVQAHRPDVFLLDIAMPGVDGLAFARRLEAFGAGAGPSVVFVTAHDAFAVEAFELAALDYLLKPVSAERLARALDRGAGRPRAAG